MLELTKHAKEKILRYMPGAKDPESTLNKLFKSSVEVMPDQIFKTKALINHNYIEAQYRKINDLIIVLVENRIITVYRMSDYAKKAFKVVEG